MKFELEIGNGAQTANDGDRFLFQREFNQESIELRDADTVDLANGLLKQIEPFLQTEERLFLVVARNGDNHFIK